MSRYPEVCPHKIRYSAMRMTWEQLTLLHWRYRPEEVQSLLPAGLTVETFDGSAWVGLVPFQMRVDVPFLPEMPRILHFPETNVRTYVSGRSGKPGVFFWSLEASSLPAVLTARSTYQVPYFWSEMTLAQDGDRLRYEARRKWPKPEGARSLVEVEVGAALGERAVRLPDPEWLITWTWSPSPPAPKPTQPTPPDHPKPGADKPHEKCET